MKKRILCLLLVMIMAISAIASLTACGGGGDDPVVSDPCAEGHTYTKGNGKCDVCGKRCKHVDENKDDVCDVCSKAIEDDEEAEYPEVPWIDEEPVSLFFRMSHNSSGESLSSGCERYLAGEDASKSEAIDEDVATRNADAEFFTNVKLKYDYYSDTAEYGWGKCHETIHKEVKSGASGTPDMYCNFAYDMIAASLKGAFANLKNTSLDQGNFFQFVKEDYNESVDNKGYMYDYMGSVTLSLTKSYILASDYFTDAIRSFFVVPVNVALLESVGEGITGDLNEDGEFTVDDFYMEVKDNKWDYTKLAAYSAAIYSNDGKTNAAEDIEDTLGFVLYLGFQSSGLLYSTDITVINKKWDETLGDYTYTYPTESPELYTLFDNVSTLVNSKGVYVIQSDPNITKYGSSNLIATRERFCDNKILFGGIIILGALEYTSYQRLKDASGFGVVPVPLYYTWEEGRSTYLTTITNGARVGAIARSTKNFTACTAFLDYQSSHSQEILDSYYYRYLCVSVVDSTVQGTVDMLYYLRLNVRSAFDKSFEDAVGVYHDDTKSCWSHILETSYFNVDIRPKYKELAAKKEGYMKTLYEVYFDLP